MKKLMLIAYSALLSMPGFCLTSEEFFAIQLGVVREMSAKGELEGKNPHQVLSGLLRSSNLSYECAGQDLNTVTFENCVMSYDVGMSPEDRSGGWNAGDWARAAGVYVGGRVVERVVDRTIDHVEASGRREVERRTREDNERNARNREREEANNRRCNFSSPSFREGDCK